MEDKVINEISLAIEKIVMNFHTFAKNKANKENLSLPQYYILFFLKDNKGLIMQDIKRGLNSSAALATSIIDQLVAKGFVSRKRNDSNRRIVNVCLTDKGKRIVNKLEKRRFRFYNLLTEDLSLQEKESMQRGLNLFVSVIEKIDKI